MSININLVDRKNPEESRKEKIRKLKGISFAILFAIGFLAILLFALDYRFSAGYVKKQQAELLSELEPYSDTSAKIFLLNSKLGRASEILGKRKKFNMVTGKIIENKPETLEIQKYTIDETGIKMTVTSVSLEPIDEYLNSTLGLIKSKAITSVFLKNLSMDYGKYTVELEII
jgi:hypothetical protein